MSAVDNRLYGLSVNASVNDTDVHLVNNQLDLICRYDTFSNLVKLDVT